MKAYRNPNWCFVLGLLTAMMCSGVPNEVMGQGQAESSDMWQFNLRYRSATKEGSERFHTLTRQENWDPKRTVVIVCDVWDSHHSINAVRRVEEVAPRIDRFVKKSRELGATIIHAPSACMDSYIEHPARKRALETPLSDSVPKEMEEWCHKIQSEESITYPIDQTDGGEDDDLKEHAEWAKKLEAMGRNPRSPWKKQIDVIAIDDEQDFISDSGPEIWSILETRGIDNVILCGVHTNMCVLGRSFGLRNMAVAGMQVVLVRDLTDTMYNPKSWPFVNHHTGTDLIVEYIEKCICPTITSDQVLGDKPFRFESDKRPLIAIMIGEDEYETEKTLPKFAADFLGKDFQVACVYADEANPNYFPGLEILNSADVALISVRRRPLSPNQLDIVKRFVEAGKPMVGIRTASHAFSLRSATVPDGLAAWPELDAQVWGGNYTNHHGNDVLPTISVIKDQVQHPILSGVATEPFLSRGSLYQVSPLAAKTMVLMTGSVQGKPSEPTAWTFDRADGGRSFYTSMGYKDDFQNPAFQRLLFNGLVWGSGIKQAQFVEPAKSEQ